MSIFKQNLQFKTENPFSIHFDEFQSSTLFKRLEQKFTPLPYYQEYKILRWVILTLSFLFNVLSGITASVLVIFFVFNISNSWIVGGVCTTVFIILLEIAKRKTNGLLFKQLYQFRKLNKFLLGMSTLFVCLSIGLSYFGSKQLVTKLHTAPVLVQTTSLTAPLQEQIALIDTQIASARKTTWKGITTTTSQRTIETLTAQKVALQKRLLDVTTNAESTNNTTMTNHQNKVYLKSEYFALITLGLELAFVLCVCYLEYYDYRSYAEFSNIQLHKDNNDYSDINLAYTRDRTDIQPLQNTDNSAKTRPATDVIERAIKQVKGRIASAKYRIRNRIGKPETSQQNINKFTSELQKLEGLL